MDPCAGSQARVKAPQLDKSSSFYIKYSKADQFILLKFCDEGLRVNIVVCKKRKRVGSD